MAGSLPRPLVVLEDASGDPGVGDPLGSVRRSELGGKESFSLLEADAAGLGQEDEEERQAGGRQDCVEEEGAARAHRADDALRGKGTELSVCEQEQVSSGDLDRLLDNLHDSSSE